MKLKLDIAPDIVAMMAGADHRCRAGAAAWQRHPPRQLPEIRRKPERGGAGLVQSAGDHRRA
tara:strand:+ start:8745 stop:8930 length:186 start_codon:yes stop_codon:yes gene_type:complete